MRNSSKDKYVFSVVVPLYNRANIIADAIDSVLAQTYNNYEILVVDDGSNDNFKEILAQYGDKVTCISQENSGPSAARNTGIRHAKGEFIAFLDSDDAWLPKKLEKQLKCFEDDPHLGLIGTGYFNCDENLRTPVQQRKIKMAKTERQEILIHNLWPTPSVVARRNCFEIVGMFNEEMKFAEDWDMWIRVAQFFPTATLDEPLVCIRKHSQSLAGAAANNDYNYELWRKIILSNRKKFSGMSFVTYLKAMSFYYLNLSHSLEMEGEIHKSRVNLVKYMMYWPFFLFDRFLIRAKMLALFRGDREV